MNTNIQIYAYSAYQFYAREGNVELYLKKLSNLVDKEYREYQTARAKRGEVKAKKTKEDIEQEVYHRLMGETNDMLAVERAIKRIEQHRKGKLIMDILLYTVFAEVVNIGPKLEVYKSTAPLHPGSRVYEAMENLHCSHFTVYKWLNYAYQVFAEERHLRVEEYPNRGRKHSETKKKITPGSKPPEDEQNIYEE